MKAGRSDPAHNLAMALQNMGGALRQQEKLAEADTALDRAIKIRKVLVKAGRTTIRPRISPVPATT